MSGNTLEKQTKNLTFFSQLSEKMQVRKCQYPISNSYMLDPPSLRVLVARLVRYLNERVHSGDLTERGLARLTGYSQPHIHNVLKGARAMRIELADHIMALLGIPLSALLTQNEIAGQGASGAGTALPVPILEGPLGAGAPFPRETVSMERRLFPSAQLDGLIRPVLARVHPRERSMWPVIWPGDFVLLDRSPKVRRKPLFEHVYAITRAGKSYLCRCRVVGRALVMVVDNSREVRGPSGPLSLSDRGVLDIVQGRIVWLGRDLSEEV